MLAAPDKDGTDMMARLHELNGQVPAPGTVLHFEASGLLLNPNRYCVYIRRCYGPLFKRLLKLRCRCITS